MILQALDKYYRRLVEEPGVDIPAYGYSRQKIHCAVVLDRNGELVEIRDLREREKGRVIPKEMMVPSLMNPRTTNIQPNFLWDNTGYVLGADSDDERGGRARQKFESFKKFHIELCGSLQNEHAAALLKFLEKWKPENAAGLPDWKEIVGTNLVFQLEGERRYYHEVPELRDLWLAHIDNIESDIEGICLVKGIYGPLARTHDKIKGVKGAQSSGASIVSFNLSAFCSYEKEQNYNAPISRSAAFAYIAALNYLLRYESRQKIQIGDATTVFWTERSSPVEGFMGMLLDPHEDEGDITKVRRYLEAVRDGKLPYEVDDRDNRFYILGLAPNASRISVRFWYVSSVEEINNNILQHYDDLRLIRQFENEPEFPSIWQLLIETAPQRKTDNIPPLLAGEVARSILTGRLYPQSLLAILVGRIRSDHIINYVRTAFIKAILVRNNRIQGKKLEVGMALDKNCTDTGYRLGRLFAVLEKAQKDANPGINATIKDRYYSSASATPGTVFPQLLRLAQHHLGKADSGSYLDRIIGEIMQGIENFPAHLDLQSQGMFAIGYYHQVVDLYTKKTE